jgi:hypothetical protein
MSRTKQNSKRKRRSKGVPVLGVAGLSLALASEASLASTSPPLDTMMRNAAVSYEITLRDEEVCDVSLATFHIFDREGAKPFGGRGAARHGWSGLLPVRVLGGPKRYQFGCAVRTQT